MNRARISGRSILTTAIGLLAVIIGSNAMALSITYDSISGYATGIKGLVIDNNTYDVDFVFGSYDSVFGTESPMFLSNQTGAFNAAKAIVNALNSEGATPQISPGPSEVLWVAYEFVPNDFFRAAQDGHNVSTDPWQFVGTFKGVPDTAYRPNWLFAKFTQTFIDTTPIPTLSNWGLIIFSVLLGFLGIAGLRRYA